MIGEYGKGLTVVISAKNIPEHDWMSFASWYSINRNLPDARVILICERGDIVFRWPYKCGLKTIYYTIHPVIPDAFEISPFVVALRSFMNPFGPVDVKSNQAATLVDYSNGCGELLFKEGMSAPFTITKEIRNAEMTLNEIKLLKLWENCEKTYKIL